MSNPKLGGLQASFPSTGDKEDSLGNAMKTGRQIETVSLRRPHTDGDGRGNGEQEGTALL
jgi:hypothetical protein